MLKPILYLTLILASCGPDQRVFCKDVAIGDGVSEYDVLEHAGHPPAVGDDLVGDCGEWIGSASEGVDWVEINAQPPESGSYSLCGRDPASEYSCSAAVDADGRILCVHHACAD